MDNLQSEPKRIGLLIVHGMGQQQRYQQLSEFATAIKNCLGWAGERQPEIKTVAVGDTLEREVTFNLTAPEVVALWQDEKKAGLPSNHRRGAEIVVMEYYWAHYIYNATNLLKVLLWFGWAVYREIIANRSPAGTKQAEVQGWFPRFLWLGFVILELFLIVAAVVGGIGCSAIVAGLALWHLGADPPTLLARLWPQTWPFLLASVGLRALFIFGQQALPPTTQIVPNKNKPVDWQKGGFVGKAPLTYLVVTFLCAPLICYAVYAAWGHWRQPTSVAFWIGMVVWALSWMDLRAMFELRWTEIVPVWRRIWAPVILVTAGLPFILLGIYDSYQNGSQNGIIATWFASRFHWLMLVHPAKPVAMAETAYWLIIAFALAVLVRLLISLGKIIWAQIGAKRRRQPLDWQQLGDAGGQLLVASTFAFAAWRGSYLVLQEGEFGVARPLLYMTMLLAAYSIIKLLLVDYFGDIATFITQEETEGSFATRKLILTEAMNRLRYMFGIDKNDQLLEKGPFDKVAIVAHSLGSCVTYDGMCRLFDRLQKGNTVDKVKQFHQRFGLYITYGCILEVVKFYFGRRASTSPLYDEINEQGQQLTNVPGGGNSAQAMLFSQAKWVNLRSYMDPFTWPGLYSFDGRPGEQVPVVEIRSNIWPVYAHVDYMNNRDVLFCLRELIKSQLL